MNQSSTQYPSTPMDTQYPSTPMDTQQPSTRATAQQTGIAGTPATQPPANMPSWLLPRQPEFSQDTLNGLLHYARSGRTLTAYCQEHKIDPGTLRHWLHADEYRKAMYYDAKAIGSEKVEDEILDIADGNYSGLPQDVQRDALRLKARQYLLEIWNRDRYGTKAKLEVGVTVDLTGVMQEARQRVERVRGRTFENGEGVDDGA